MGILIIVLLIILAASVRLFFDRRSFFAGLIVAFAALVTSFLGIFWAIHDFQSVFDPKSRLFSAALMLLFVLLPLLVGGLLIFNTHVMQLREGKSLTAKLSLFFGTNLIFCLILSYFLLAFLYQLNNIVVVILFSLLMIDLSFIAVFVGYLFYSFLYQRFPVKTAPDYIIVLGTKIRRGGLSPVLKSRVDKAIEYYQKSPEKTKIVVSGAKGKYEPYSEAFGMAQYLAEQGIPADRILLEDKSHTTFQNMQFSKQLIEMDWYWGNHTSQPTIIFTTNNFHVFRGAIYARKVGLKANGVGAPTPLYYLPTALFREYVALLVHYKWFTIAIIIGWILLGIGLAAIL
ncbi:YdcF family protein [Lentilactobacillus sp. Marseille-Q4993]|uniref:YdcF family protein n=1 Tax=Lentilactobacillus sp. Marseille-Q4993 TaxID=3039492 RepID=UPI0024BD3042|nr:YdcF family protein [Lentilactobacillus sp. Marseille-Q4993]